jgi:hypothetical protein
MPSRKRRPPATRRSALELLAASPDGCTEAILIGLAPRGDRAHPWRSYRRRGCLYDPTDHGAVREYVEVVIAPFSGWARSRRAFENEARWRKRRPWRTDRARVSLAGWVDLRGAGGHATRR